MPQSTETKMVAEYETTNGHLTAEWRDGNYITVQNEQGEHVINVYNYETRGRNVPSTAKGLDKAIRQWLWNSEPRARVVSGRIEVIQVVEF